MRLLVSFNETKPGQLLIDALLPRCLSVCAEHAAFDGPFHSVAIVLCRIGLRVQDLGVRV